MGDRRRAGEKRGLREGRGRLGDRRRAREKAVEGRGRWEIVASTRGHVVSQIRARVKKRRERKRRERRFEKAISAHLLDLDAKLGHVKDVVARADAREFLPKKEGDTWQAPREGERGEERRGEKEREGEERRGEKALRRFERD